MAVETNQHTLLSIAACLVLLAGACAHSASASSTQQMGMASALQASIASSATDILPGQIITLTASFNGGTEPYSVSWYSGTNQQCSGDTDLLHTDTQVYRTSDLLSVYPPDGGSYYCVEVSDSSDPALTAYSPVVGIMVGSSESTTVTTVASSPGGTVQASNTVVSPGTEAVISQLCAIVDSVRSIIGIITLVLFMLGGILYAVSHFLPSNMEFKKSMTGWSQAMIVGGVIGLIIVLIAQPLILLIIGLGQSAGGSAIQLVSC